MKVTISIEGYDDIECDDATRILIYDSESKVIDLKIDAKKGITKRQQVAVVENIQSRAEKATAESDKLV